MNTPLEPNEITEGKNVPHGTSDGIVSDEEFNELCGFFERCKSLGTTERMFARCRVFSARDLISELLKRYRRLELDRDNWRKQALTEDERANVAEESNKIEAAFFTPTDVVKFIKDNEKVRNMDCYVSFNDMVKGWSETYGKTHNLPINEWMFSTYVGGVGK